MTKFRIVVCSLVASAGLLGIVSETSAQGLVGFYVYRDMMGRGLLISSFIPGSSADTLHQQGQLFSGDIITRYNGQPVYSAAHVRAISAQAMPGEWLQMEFLTPSGQPFYHYVQPGGGSVAACAPDGKSYQRWRKGSSRPSAGGNGSGRPGGPGRPGRPQGPGRPGRPQGPGRPW